MRRCRSHHWATLKAAHALTCRMQLQCLDRIKSCGRMTWKDCKVGSCPNTSHAAAHCFLACAAAGQRSMQSDVGELEDATGWDRALHMRFRIALPGGSGPACPRGPPFDGATPANMHQPEWMPAIRCSPWPRRSKLQRWTRLSARCCLPRLLKTAAAASHLGDLCSAAIRRCAAPRRALLSLLVQAYGRDVA